MRDIFIIIFMVGMVPAILRWPFLGILGWCVVSYLNPHQLGWGMTNTMPFGMLIGLTTLLAYGFSSQYRKAIPLQPITVLLMVFLGYMTLTTVFALAPSSAWEKWEKVFKILLMTFITVPMMATRERIHALVWTIVVCIGFYGVKGGLFTLMNGGGYRVWGPPNTAIEDNNHLATALIMLLPLVRYLHLQSADVWVKRALLLALVFIGASIIGSYSRGAFVAGCACLFWLFLKSRHKLAIVGLGVFAVILGLIIMPPQWMSRMTTILEYAQDESVQGRFDAWTFGWRLAQMRPLLGGGFNPIDAPGLFKQLVPGAEVARAFHSNYFEVLGEPWLHRPGAFPGNPGHGLRHGRTHSPAIEEHSRPDVGKGSGVHGAGQSGGIRCRRAVPEPVHLRPVLPHPHHPCAAARGDRARSGRGKRSPPDPRRTSAGQPASLR